MNVGRLWSFGGQVRRAEIVGHRAERENEVRPVKKVTEVK
jgi:hypothetical protein